VGAGREEESEGENCGQAKGRRASESTETHGMSLPLERQGVWEKYQGTDLA
jgi:hypothetical protein